jgi:hypothetical protein
MLMININVSFPYESLFRSIVFDVLALTGRTLTKNSEHHMKFARFLLTNE